jgi:hypothetical protein
MFKGKSKSVPVLFIKKNNEQQKSGDISCHVNYYQVLKSSTYIGHQKDKNQ